MAKRTSKREERQVRAGLKPGRTYKESNFYGSQEFLKGVVVFKATVKHMYGRQGMERR